MSTLLRVIFLYLPASFAYYTLIYAILIMTNVVKDPNEFDPNDYREIGSHGNTTYYEIKK